MTKSKIQHNETKTFLLFLINVEPMAPSSELAQTLTMCTFAIFQNSQGLFFSKSDFDIIITMSNISQTKS